MITTEFEFELISVSILAMLLIYLVSIWLANTYFTLTPKDHAKLAVIYYMLGILTVGYIFGSLLFLLVPFLVIIVFVISSVFKVHRHRKGNKSIPSMQNGGVNQ